MKKIKYFAYVWAIALLSTGFVACSSEEEVADNPNYNPETREVNANFVFSVATSNTPSTRMSAANTQADLDQTFRGINSAELLAIKLGTENDGKHVKAISEVIPTGDNSNVKVFSLGTALPQGYLEQGTGSTQNSETNGQNQSRRVIELSLPTETNALLFYGKAIAGSVGDNKKVEDVFGKIDWNVNKDISQNSFKLVQRVGSEKQQEFKDVQTLIADFLTALCEAGISPDTEGNPKQFNFGGETITVNSLKWSQFATITASDITPKNTSPLDQSGQTPMSSLGEILADEFVNFNKVWSGEIRAGSAAAVARMLSDIYIVVNKMASDTETPPASLQDVVAKAVAQGISEKIKAVLNDPGTNLEWLDAGHIATAASKTTTLTSTFNINGFPNTLYNVPMGAAQLTTTLSEGKVTWQYTTDLPMSGMGGGTTSVFNYMYPAELCYFGNSPIRVTNDTHVTDDYPQGVTNWDSEAQWAAGVNNNTVAWTSPGHVLSTTRSVAMKENINYGTALLKSTVRYGAATLKDNNHAIQQSRTGANEQDNEIDAETTSPFTLTGIVIGGQEPEMGWNYIAKSTSPTFAPMIYDKDLPITAIPVYTTGGAKSEPNYTLVWDNWNQGSLGNKQNDVYIALEFVNNTGKDFWGEKNIVRNGGTFYIIGKLDPDANLSTTDRSAGITWPEKYALPPYDATTGNTIKQRRVFIQDFVTEANFVIGETSLQHAYVTVPDLRSTQISLGLSVDLKWQTGLTFSEVILGNQ